MGGAGETSLQRTIALALFAASWTVSRGPVISVSEGVVGAETAWAKHGLRAMHAKTHRCG
jgi:hypothetical protein